MTATRRAKAGSAADTASTEAKHSGLIPFQPGQSGNPAGRPKGSRNKLGEAFVSALHDDFNEHGIAAIQSMRAADPGAYVRVVAGLLPKEFKIETTSDLTDEQLDARIRQLAAALEIGIGGPADRTPAALQPDALN